MPAGSIVFDHVWKRFHRGPAHDSLRDLIPALVRRRGKKGQEQEALRTGDFWAVRDVSFEVHPGEALGIIGGNGAGKSTILKLLNRILVPSRGRAEVTGRAGALIEVSAGFHPDLTGRENVFLQGAIMGMPQKLIREKYDEIVEFSGITAFIDTPVKRYSSGMNARLGFSIAVHLEPDVLLVDEVLSVGDAEFQGKAFEKIQALVKSNIPVVIVSHQLDRIVELCTSCILLRQGQAAFHGSASQAVHEYLHGAGGGAGVVAPEETSEIVLHELRGPDPQPVVSGETFTLTLTGTHHADVPAERLAVVIFLVDAATNQRVYSNYLQQLGAHPRGRGDFEVNLSMQANLPPGLYRIETVVWDDSRSINVGQGPTRLFQVTPGRLFDGSHQLNATVV